MEKENRVVYLNEPREPYVDLQDFYEIFNIPSRYRKNGSYVFIPFTTSDGIEYICPKCAARLKAEWKYIDSVNNRLIKSEYRSENYCCKLKKYDPRNDVISNWDCDTTVAPEYSSNDYEDAKKLEVQLNETAFQNSTEMLEEMRKVANMSHCPVCNAKLIKRFPYIADCISTIRISSHEVSDVCKWYNEYCDNIPRAKRKEEKEKTLIGPYLEQYSTFIQNCDVTPLPKILKTAKTADFLKEYLMNLINLETNIRCMSKRLKELYLLRGANDKDVAFEQGFPNLSLAKKIEQKRDDLLALENERADFQSRAVTYEIVKYPPEPKKPELLKPFFFNRKKVEAANAQAEENYQAALDKYRLTIKECETQTENNRIAAEKHQKDELAKRDIQVNKCKNELNDMQISLKSQISNAGNIPTPAVGKKAILDKEIATVEESLKKSYQCRNELYSYNVVFDKYRDIVAISTFYEYLMSGRCESLEGINGAYNIYENDIRMNTIIIKLDEIKENQFTIYKKLQSIDSSLHTLNNSMNKAVSSLESISSNMVTMNTYLENISKNTEVIAHNTAVSAYYSKVNAELTNALGFMVALN